MWKSEVLGISYGGLGCPSHKSFSLSVSEVHVSQKKLDKDLEVYGVD